MKSALRTDTYANFERLNEKKKKGVHFEIQLVPVEHSSIAIIAPHGGAIEAGTSIIAKDISGIEFNFYAFEGTQNGANFQLHITSSHFDEPDCLALVARCSTVIAIHGYPDRKERVFLSGLNLELVDKLERKLRDAGIPVEQHGKFQGKDGNKICNRGKTGMGIQIELSRPFREGELVQKFVKTIRNELLTIQSRQPIPSAR